jgi:aryl-alcohol dehydrogenase-like predicted oxidoreductase
MDQMAQALQQGKIRAVGVSNFSASQMRQAADRLARYTTFRWRPMRFNINLLHRHPEVNGVLDACRELNVAMVAFVPLASGRLTASLSHPVTVRSSSSSSKAHKELQDALLKIAEKRGKSISQVMLNWLLKSDEHIIPIP